MSHSRSAEQARQQNTVLMSTGKAPHSEIKSPSRSMRTLTSLYATATLSLSLSLFFPSGNLSTKSTFQVQLYLICNPCPHTHFRFSLPSVSFFVVVVYTASTGTSLARCGLRKYRVLVCFSFRLRKTFSTASIRKGFKQHSPRMESLRLVHATECKA